MKENLYLMYADARFIRQELKELTRAAELSAKLIEHIAPFLSIVEIKGAPELKILKALQDMRPIFIENLMPMAGMIEGENADDIVKFLCSHIEKSKSFRIEVIRYRSGIDQSAKDMEVKIGTTLEGLGYLPDLISPSKVICLLFHDGNVYVAIADSNLLCETVMDRFRSENKNTGIVNRSEIKIKEAFEIFKLDGERFPRCLDLGAAPGGWTKFLMGKGARVVAIDNGNLDYEKIGKCKSAVIRKGENSYQIDSTRNNKPIEFTNLEMLDLDLIHIKATMRSFDDLPFSLGRFDLATIDTNTEIKDSLNAALSLAKLLKSSGGLIMTLKLFSIHDADNIDDIKAELAVAYKNITIKKLPHNRMELTLFARKK
jgi:23S rRNA (cytidine2498-2'-O)-methyltransferase